MEELLKDLQQRELERVEGKRYEIERLYKQVPVMVQRVSKLLKIDPEELVRACALASKQYANVEWYTVLSYVQTFHITLEHLRSSQSTEEKQ